MINYEPPGRLGVRAALAEPRACAGETGPGDPRPDGTPVYLRHFGPSPAEIGDVVQHAVAAEMFTRDYADVFEGDDRWRELDVPAGDTFAWDTDSTYVRKPPYFEGLPDKPAPVSDIHGARVLA